MINLLPPDYKAMVKRARSNRVLLAYVLYFALVVATSNLVMAYGSTLVSGTSKDIDAEIKETQNIANELKPFHDQAFELKKDIDLVAKISDNQVRISVLMDELADILPPGVVLTNLNLSEDKTGPIKLDLKSTTTNGISTALVNIQESEMFKGAEIILDQHDESENLDDPANKFIRLGGINAYIDETFDFDAKQESNDE